MLREVLVACAGEGFKTWNQDDFGHLLLSLKKTQLLVWENGLAIDPGLRYVIQNYFIVIEPDIFIQVNKAALRVYAGWLEHPVDNRSLLVLEELYHHAALLHVGEHVDLIEILDRRLAEYPNYIKDDSGVFNALERLETEITNDKELEQFTHSAYELARQVRAFRDKRYAAR